MNRLLLVGCVLLAGCQSDAERCREILLQRFKHRVANAAPPSDADRNWYADHCTESGDAL